MCESRKFFAEAKFVCPIFGGCEGMNLSYCFFIFLWSHYHQDLLIDNLHHSDHQWLPGTGGCPWCPCMMSSWKHCLALSGSSEVALEALLEPGTRNSSSRAVYSTNAAHGCHRALPGRLNGAAERRAGVCTRPLHAPGLSWGGTTKDAPPRCSEPRRFKMRSEDLLDMVKAGYGRSGRAQMPEQPGEQKY